MIPNPYNVQVPMMQQGRRQNQQEYYHPGYYQQPQYHHAQHNPYPQQWYPAPYQQPAYRPYMHYPPQGHHNAPMVVSSHPQHHHHIPPQHRQSYSSPAPTHVPVPVPAPVHAMTPSVSTPLSTQSNEPQAPSTPSPVPVTSSTVYTPTESVQNHPASPELSKRVPFYPKLPWYSVPESDFPTRPRRRRRRARHTSPSSLELPQRSADPTSALAETFGATSPSEHTATAIAQPELGIDSAQINASISDLSIESPSRQKSDVSAEESSTTHTTPKSHVKPALPVVPITPRGGSLEQTPAAVASTDNASSALQQVTGDAVPQDEAQTSIPETAPSAPKAPPKSWAELLRSRASAAQPPSNTQATSPETSSTPSKSASLAEVIKAFDVNSDAKISFLEPRGLVNTGNMCYMNSILQVLVFCVPFYDFLEQVGKKAAHSFKSDTPLLDAMILFMREFNVIDAADSVEKLRMRLKDNELEQYGENLIPEYVYGAIKRLPRFATMRRGHQQDAEEFMGFLFEGLHDECVSVLKNLPLSPQAEAPASPVQDRPQAAEAGWLEVGPKQKSSVTRSTGFMVTDSPITKIFGFKIRSELRVPGLKNSVTMEPYQALQLDIGAPNIQNVVDALKGFSRPETLHGDFGSPRGPGTTATKQTFIDTLPPVLILHLKRFQYDNTGGTQKIWKKVGYPLELTMPKEVFSPSRRNAVALQGMPQYRLSAVVYHHGKNASGGHYTVDTRRQDGQEWIRLDDTMIRRLRAEDVASAGAEEDPKVLAKALELHRRQQSTGQNMFESFGSGAEEDEEDGQSGWSQVNGSSSKDASSSGRKWAAVANGERTPSTGKRTPKQESLKDNKVAYILFYRKIE